MPYSQFTISKVKQDFGLTTIEGKQFFPLIQPILPSPALIDTLTENLPLATAIGTEKARSEMIIAPLLIEVRRLLNRSVSLFSGTDFTVEPEVGLNGMCDFLISRSPEQLDIEAPAVVIVEAKKGDLNPGIGQCLAEMVAAQRFNQARQRSITAIYGSVSSGTQWRFLKLEHQTAYIDLVDYSLPPIDVILGILVWMVKEG
jgi:hypothetical protein